MHVSCAEGFHPGINLMIFLFWMPEGWPWMKEYAFRTARPQGTAHTSPSKRSTSSIPTARQKHIHTSMLSCCRQGNSFLLCRHECVYTHQRIVMVCSAGSIHFPLSRNFNGFKYSRELSLNPLTHCFAINNHNVFEA